MNEKAKFDNYRNITMRLSSETSCIVKQSKKTVFLPQILGIFKIVPIFYWCSNYFFDKTFEKHFEKAISMSSGLLEKDLSFHLLNEPEENPSGIWISSQPLQHIFLNNLHLCCEKEVLQKRCSDFGGTCKYVAQCLHCWRGFCHCSPAEESNISELMHSFKLFVNLTEWQYHWIM